MKTIMKNTKKILRIVAITLLIAMALVGAGTAEISNYSGQNGGAHTFFNYQYVYSNDILTAGNYETKGSSGFFNVPVIGNSNDYYIPGDLPAGIYYLNGDKNNTPIYINPISTSYVSDSFGTKVIGDKVTVTTQNAANLIPLYYIKKDGEGAFLSTFPSGQTLWDGKFINEFPEICKPYISKEEDIGTWKVYVSYINGLEGHPSSGISILDRYGALYNKAPDNARFLEIGTLKIVSSKKGEPTIVKISNTTTKSEPEVKKEVINTVSITGTSAVNVGDTVLFSATNSDGSSAKFSWKSSDDSVATVDENGNVIALKAGTATITVTNNNTGNTASKTITVVAKAEPEKQQTTKSPGFGILAVLSTLGAAYIFVLRRKD